MSSSQRTINSVYRFIREIEAGEFAVEFAGRTVVGESGFFRGAVSAQMGNNIVDLLTGKYWRDSPTPHQSKKSSAPLRVFQSSPLPEIQVCGFRARFRARCFFSRASSFRTASFETVSECRNVRSKFSNWFGPSQRAAIAAIVSACVGSFFMSFPSLHFRPFLSTTLALCGRFRC